MLRIAGAVLAVGLCVTGCGAAPMDGEAVQRLTDQGVDPDLIYHLDLPGFTALEQSAEPTGDGGFRMTYVSDSDPSVRAEFRAHPSEFTEELCTSTPIPHSDGTLPTECPSDKGWHRSSGGFHEYILTVRHGHIRLSAPLGVLESMPSYLGDLDHRWGPASQP